MNELSLTSSGPEATARLAEVLADLVLRLEHPTAFYLFGPLGCGKTTLIRSFCAKLPGGEQAEVASPSFTICNEYPTRPPVFHVDLYRLGRDALLPEEADERPKNALLALEWPENLQENAFEPQRLDLHIAPIFSQNLETLDISSQSCEKFRSVKFVAHGQSARDFLDALAAALPSDFFVKAG